MSLRALESRLESTLQGLPDEIASIVESEVSQQVKAAMQHFHGQMSVLMKSLRKELQSSIHQVSWAGLGPLHSRSHPSFIHVIAFVLGCQNPSR